MSSYKVMQIYDKNIEHRTKNIEQYNPRMDPLARNVCVAHGA